MTTTWGRVLVFANLVIAVGACAWVFGLYSARIDWSNKAAKGAEPAGELFKRQARLRDLDNNETGALTVAERRQRASALSLRLFEQRRPRDAKLFADELAHLQSGINDKDPLRIPEFKNGEMVLKADGSPNMIVAPFKDRKDQPFNKGLVALDNDLKAAQAALLESIAEYQARVNEDVKQTERIVGDKGLRQQLYDEVDVKQARIKHEIEDLKPLYINVLVESELLLKRQKSLEARVNELDKAVGRTTKTD